MRSLLKLLGLGCFALSASCAFETGSTEDTAQLSAPLPLVGGWAIGPLGHDVSGPSVSTHICLLTSVAGGLVGDSTFAVLSQSTVRWRLVNVGVTAEYYCFPRSSFIGGPTTLAPRVAVETQNQGVPAFVQTAPGTAFPFITGVWGNFASAGAIAAANESLFIGTPSTFTAIGGATKAGVAGTALTVGSSRRLARYVLADGSHTDVTRFNGFRVSPTQKRVVMAPTADAACVLSAVLGSSTGAVSLKIAPETINGVEHWVLTTRGSTAQGGWAHCFARDQTF